MSLLPNKFDRSISDDLWLQLKVGAELLLAPQLQQWLTSLPHCNGVEVSLYCLSKGVMQEICTVGSSSGHEQLISWSSETIQETVELRLFNEGELLSDDAVPEYLAIRLDWLEDYQRQLQAAKVFNQSTIIQYEAAEQDGRWVLTQANPALEDFLGTDIESLLGGHAKKVLTDFIHPDDITSLISSYDATRTTSEQMTLQYRLLSADGRYVPVTERVKYFKEADSKRCISTIWHRELDQIDSQAQYQIFKDIEATTADLSLLSGRQFLHHFCRRMVSLDGVDSLSLIALTKNQWWESWALYHGADKLPDCHLKLADSSQMRQVSWNLQDLLAKEDTAQQILFNDYPYQSVVPMQFEGEPVVACLILGSSEPLTNIESVMQLVRLLSLRLLREIKQVRIAEAQWEQNLQLQQQKQQLTQMVTLLGDLDTVADEMTFLRTSQDQLRRIFNLKDIDWAVWNSGEWRLVEIADDADEHHVLAKARHVEKDTWVEKLEATRRHAEMIMYRGRMRIFWPVGSALGGFMVLALTFRKAIPDKEFLAFAHNALVLAHQGLVQRENLHRQAMYDSLTGLGNRTQLHAWIKVALPVQTQASLLLFDLNRFKEINDSFGHQFGDRLLCEIGPRISSSLPHKEHFLARLGGDEFALFLPDVEPGEALEIGAQLHEKLAQSYTIDALRFQVEASIGVSHYPTHGQDGHELLRCADVAMYAAKHSHRSVVEFESQLDNSTPMRIAVLSELDQAIVEGQLSVAYQPLMQTDSGQVAGFEALVRWKHPQFGQISPADFIPLAEVGEGIRKITDFVLRKTMEYLVNWRLQAPGLHVALNISPRVLLDHDFPTHVAAMLKEFDLPGDSIIMELTESTLLVDPVRAVEIIHTLSDLGVKVEIDDFGTGYSSLAYLKSLPISALKIDQSFVTDIVRDNQNEVIVQSTVQMAHNLGLQVVAEGVEDEATLLKMIRLGCDLIQGYYFAKPIPGDEVQLWLTRNL